MNPATPEFYVHEILALRKKAGPIYGDNVIPAITMYKALKEAHEKRAFQEALERLLTDPDEDKRNYGVTLCLGFFVFRDVV